MVVFLAGNSSGDYLCDQDMDLIPIYTLPC